MFQVQTGILFPFLLTKNIHWFHCSWELVVFYSPLCRGHRWELPGIYRDFIEVMVFYFFCWRTKRILITAITGFKIYILIQSLMLLISENNRVIFFWNYHGTFLYIYSSRSLYVTVIYFHGAVFIPLIFVIFCINLLHQISLPESLFSHLLSNITTWQIHMVTNPQSTISFLTANHRTLTILWYSPQ